MLAGTRQPIAEDGGMEGDTHAEQVSFVKKAAAKT